MKKLFPAPGSCENYHDDIVSKKHSSTRARLNTLSPIIKGRISAYETNKEELSVLAPLGNWSVDDQEKLLNCYKSKTAPLKKMLDDIRTAQDEHGRAKCQYCGVSFPSTFDHYLPKSSYPEFSVLSINLLPCCPDCNNLKGEVGIVGTERCCINLYYDVLPTTRYLFATINYSGGDLDAHFSIRNNGRIDTAIFDLIQKHYEKLKLLERYRHEVHLYISEISRSIRLLREVFSEDGIRSFLLSKAADDERFYGVNSFKTALTHGLAESPEFINGCLR